MSQAGSRRNAYISPMKTAQRIPFRFILGHLAIGVACGWLVLGGVLWFDIGGLAGLLVAAPSRSLILAMLLAVFAITWGSAAMGAAIMSLDRDDGPAGGLPNRSTFQLARATQIVAPSRP
jgi:hypothetical protein